MKKNIVLLHGWGASTSKLETLGKALQKRGWKVLIPKLPGFDAPDPESAWGLDEYAEWAETNAKKTFLQEKFIVFGHSFGGRVAIKIASLHASSLSGVVLCASGGISRASWFKRTAFEALAQFGKALDLGKIWRRLLYKLAREQDYEKASENMRSVFKKVIREDLKPSVRLIKVPIYILWGFKDKVTPVSDAYVICGLAQNFKMFIFPDQGHRLPYEKSHEVAEKVNQWAEHL